MCNVPQCEKLSLLLSAEDRAAMEEQLFANAAVTDQRMAEDQKARDNVIYIYNIAQMIMAVILIGRCMTKDLKARNHLSASHVYASYRDCNHNFDRSFMYRCDIGVM
jgi:hypothetical protein